MTMAPSGINPLPSGRLGFATPASGCRATSGRRAATFAVLTALACVIPLTVLSQTQQNPPVRLFISNEDEWDDEVGALQVSSTRNGTVAQEFATGPLSVVPRNVTLWIDPDSASTIDASLLTVAIWRNGTRGPQRASAVPPGRYITLVKPADLSAGERVFTYSGNDALEANSTYHLVVQFNRNPTQIVLQTSTRTGVTSALDGWSLGSRWRGRDGDSWGVDSGAFFASRLLRFKLEGIQNNAAATGAPKITGPVQVDQTLTANTDMISDFNGTSEATFDYQWYRYEADSDTEEELSGATSATYDVQSTDLGKRFGVRVMFADDDGYEEVIPPTPLTAEVESSDVPIITVASNVSSVVGGSGAEGETVAFTLTRTGDTAAEFPVDVSVTGDGALASELTEITMATFPANSAMVEVPVKTAAIAIGDSDEMLTLTVQDIDGYAVGTPSSATVTVTAPQDSRATGRPGITGTVSVGETLSAEIGSIVDLDDQPAISDLSCVWQRQNILNDDSSWENIAGADTCAYTVVDEDFGKRLRVQATFQDGVFSQSETLTSEATAAALPNISVEHNGNVNGGENAVFTLTRTGETDDELVVNIEITGTGLLNPPVPPPTATFEASMSTVEVEVPTVTIAPGGGIKGVTIVIMSGSGYNVPNPSVSGRASLIVLAPQNIIAIGNAVLTGTPVVGQTLMVARGTIDDANGLTNPTFSYDWHRIEVGTESSEQFITDGEPMYTLTEDDVGFLISASLAFRDDLNNPENRESNRLGPVEAAGGGAQTGNATGAPAIAGTAQVGQELTATTGDIADEDGLPTAASAFSYQWSRADDTSGAGAETITGATSATYRPVAADAGKHLRVTVSFTDQGGFRESRESDWTLAVAAAPLTFSISAPTAPASAVEPALGETAVAANEIVFTVTPSEPPGSPVTVTYSLGGTATEGVDYDEHTTKMLVFSAADIEGQITISAIGDIVFESDETVIVTLVSVSEGEVDSGSNSATGTITERQDQIQVSATRPAFDYSEDDSETTVSFTVEIDSTTAPAGTVDWRVVIRDSAGRIVRQTERNTANIGGSASSRRVTTTLDAEPPAGGSIEILLQPFAEQGEAAVSAVAPSNDLADGDKKVVTVDSTEWVVAGLIATTSSAISNDRAITSALTAFGRSTATSLVESIWSRAEAHRLGNVASFASLGGRSIDATAFAPGAGAKQAARETARLFGIETVDPATVSTSGDAGESLTEGNFDDFRTWAGLEDGSHIAGKSSFALALGESGGSSIVYWGAGSLSNFSSELENDNLSTLTSEGSNTTISLGLDYRQSKSMLLGLAVSSSTGSAEYKYDDEGEGNGDLSSSLTTFTPWLHWKSSAGMELWGAFGIGSGSADGMRSGEKVEMDLGAQIIAIGAWNQITTFGNSNIAAKADYFSATVSSDGAGDEVDGTDAGSSRIRVAAEMSSGRSPSSGSSTAYAFELGARLDSGEAESGFGVDVAAEFDYGGPRSSVSVTGRGGLTLFHGQEGFSETGFGLGITYDPGADARGLQLSLSPAWNPPRSNSADSVWNAVSSETFSPSKSEGAEIEARLGYGIAAMENHALATLYGGVKGKERENWLRLGGEIMVPGRRIGGLRLDLYGEAGERRDGPERAVRLEGSLNF